MFRFASCSFFLLNQISFYRTLVESGINNDDRQEARPLEQYWEKIERYYIQRLDSLSKEIESSITQNTKLSVTRDELLKEILNLTQKSIDLTNKNELLSRSIAEKENHISAFMYNDHSKQQQQHHQIPVIGVTLVDQPYTLPPIDNNSNEEPTALVTSPFTSNCTSSSSSLNDNSIAKSTTAVNTPSTSISSSTPKKENQPGLFRQISLRLSTRKRRQQDDSNNNAAQKPALNISEPINTTPVNVNVIPITSASEPLLHPAAVVASSFTSSSQSHYTLQQDTFDSSNKRKKSKFPLC